MNNLNQRPAPTGPSRRGAEPAQILLAVSQHPFLKGMSAAHLNLLAQGATRVNFRAGDLVFKQGDAAIRFYLIIWGSVSLTHSGPKRNTAIQCLSAGDALGWSWLFPPYAWHFNAMVTEPTQALEFDGEALRRLCGEQRDFGYELMARISQVVIERLQKSRLKFFKLTGEL